MGHTRSSCTEPGASVWASFVPVLVACTHVMIIIAGQGAFCVVISISLSIRTNIQHDPIGPTRLKSIIAQQPLDHVVLCVIFTEWQRGILFQELIMLTDGSVPHHLMLNP